MNAADPRKGFVNAHCHLELGPLRGAIPEGLPFAEWLRRLVPLKRAMDSAASTRAAADGIAALRAAGCTTIADVLSLDTSAAPLAAADGIERLAFFELIEFQPTAADVAVDRALDRQSAARRIPAVGLSPHAPYTTTAPLVARAAAEARRRGQWLCIHAAETPEETALLLHGTGPLAEFLAPIHHQQGWTAPAMRPIPWLDRCGALGPETLLVHCNDIDDDDIALIAARRASVVVCPGTHLYFRRGAFPLSRLLRAGVPCLLGTDSLASNAELDMAREVAIAVELSPGIASADIDALARRSPFPPPESR